MSGTPSSYRDRIYIVKDVILKLVEYGELNQTALMSFCGLNLKKHKPILDDLEENGLVSRVEKTVGKRTVAIYRPTQRGIDFSRNILEPYEKMFPRRKQPVRKKETESPETGNNNSSKHLMQLLLLV
ncbi:MAG TPA: winged helix-turn-helix domain-containing protein [Nitrososphaera sp.]|jgi:predicted transcriptional regulator